MANSHRAAGARPFSIRLTDDERTTLLNRAGRMPLGAYVRRVLLEDGAAPRAGHARTPVVHADLLARVLAMLGQSGIAGNLRRLGEQAETGILPVDESVSGRIRQACDAMLAMRVLVLHALGKQGTAEDRAAREALSRSFQDRAGPEARP